MIAPSVSSDSPRFLITGLNGVTGWNLFQSVEARFACQGTFRKDHVVFKPEKFTKLDFEDPYAIDECLRKWQPTHVIHSWAMCDLDLCEVFPDMARKINVLGTDRLIQALSTLPSLRKLVFRFREPQWALIHYIKSGIIIRTVETDIHDYVENCPREGNARERRGECPKREAAFE